MKETFITALLLFATLLAPAARAVEVGDIYFSDKTFAGSMQSGKKAIGLVYWVSANKDYGYIMSLEEPAEGTMNPYNANIYCLEYFTEGTKAGDWKLPQRIEMIRMGYEKNNGQVIDKFTTLNNKLKSVTKASGGAATQLTATHYVTNSYLPYAFAPNNGTYAGGGGWNAGSGTKYRVRCITVF